MSQSVRRSFYLDSKPTFLDVLTPWHASDPPCSTGRPHWPLQLEASGTFTKALAPPASLLSVYRPCLGPWRFSFLFILFLMHTHQRCSFLRQITFWGSLKEKAPWRRLSGGSLHVSLYDTDFTLKVLPRNIRQRQLIRNSLLLEMEPKLHWSRN